MPSKPLLVLFSLVVAAVTMLGQCDSGSIAEHFHTIVVSQQEKNYFPGRTRVNVQGKSSIRMDELQIGDAVQQPDGSYSPVYGFAHHAPRQAVEYLQIYTNHSQRALEISAEQMLDVNQHWIAAGEIKAGDVLEANGTPMQVNFVSQVVLVGAYAPRTLSGTIVVNEITVSSSATTTSSTQQPWLPFISHSAQQWWHYAVHAPYYAAVQHRFSA